MPDLPELSTGEWISLVVALAALLALGVAAAQLRLAIIGLRRTSQPVVVVHEVGSDIADQGEGIEYRAYLENHGAGTAFNVRFGILLAGTSYPYVFAGEERAARQLVPAGGRVPGEGELRVRASWAPFLRGGEDASAGRVYWARYENAFGETWETLNPGDPTRDFEIRRVRRRALKRREAKELDERRRIEAETNKQFVQDLEALRQQGENHT